MLDPGNSLSVISIRNFSKLIAVSVFCCDAYYVEPLSSTHGNHSL